MPIEECEKKPFKKFNKSTEASEKNLERAFKERRKVIDKAYPIFAKEREEEKQRLLREGRCPICGRKKVNAKRGKRCLFPHYRIKPAKKEGK